MDFRQIAEVWRKSAIRWFVAYYTIGWLSLFFSGVVAAGPDLLRLFDLGPDWVRAFGFLSVVATGTLALFKPQEMGGRFRRAWSHLGSTLVRHENGLASIEDVVSAYNTGEQIIHETHVPQPSTLPTPK
jgi:hypothetical protein